MITPNQINIARIKAEVEAAFHSYETALVQNDLDTLDSLFWQSTQVVRFGAGENLYGIDAIRAFRAARDAGALQRTLGKTRITTYADDFATTTTEFVRADGAAGRQSQTWVRFTGGWRIVAAHIDLYAGNDDSNNTGS